MNFGAPTPEELEMLFEDVLIRRDREGLAELFADGAVLLAGDEQLARGSAEIVRLALATWKDDGVYVAEPQGVAQARDIALIVTKRGINVVRRGGDGTWRYAIMRLVEDGIERTSHDTGRESSTDTESLSRYKR